MRVRVFEDSPVVELFGLEARQLVIAEDGMGFTLFDISIPASLCSVEFTTDDEHWTFYVLGGSGKIYVFEEDFQSAVLEKDHFAAVPAGRKVRLDVDSEKGFRLAIGRNPAVSKDETTEQLNKTSPKTTVLALTDIISKFLSSFSIFFFCFVFSFFFSHLFLFFFFL